MDINTNPGKMLDYLLNYPLRRGFEKRKV